MADSSATSRTLRLLELLQARRFWAGEDLARRLGVTGRTLRRDVERLRELGYRIRARRGREGGYELSPGDEIPPLLFTAEEAAALTAVLSSAAASGQAGGGEVALTALGKLEHVMPASVRHRVRTLRAAVSIGASPDGPEVDTELLAVLALACRDNERLRLTYAGVCGERAGARLTRRVEPVRLVPRGTRWYLLCWDLERDDWRTLRVDRISDARRAGVRTAPRPVPGVDAAAFVATRFEHAQLEVAATIRIDAPLAEVAERLGPYARDLTEAEAHDGHPVTDWHITDVRVEVLAAALVWLIWPFEVLDSPELSRLLRDCGARFTAAAAD